MENEPQPLKVSFYGKAVPERERKRVGGGREACGC